MTLLTVVCSEEFWSKCFATLSGQSRDGASLVYVTAALAQLPAVGVIDDIQPFRYVSVISDVVLVELIGPEACLEADYY